MQLNDEDRLLLSDLLIRLIKSDLDQQLKNDLQNMVHDEFESMKININTVISPISDEKPSMIRRGRGRPRKNF